MRPAVVWLATLLALATAPAASEAWGPPRSGGFGASVMLGGPAADFLRGAEGPDRIHGRGGDDLLTGDTGPDVLVGGPGDDTLPGGSGGDRIDGNAGGDVATGSFGDDILRGGAGDDALNGEQSQDVVLGGPGNDVLHGGSGIDVVEGGPGNDQLYADSGGDTLTAGAGDDTIVVDGAAAAHVSCGAGRDTVYLTIPQSATADYVGNDSAGVRDDDCETILLTDAVLDPNKGVTYLAPDTGGERIGTALDDVLLGGPGADTLRGLGGNDVIWGLYQLGLTSSEPDVIDAGPGDDTVYGGPGPQRIIGGAGNDFLESGVGDGTIDGGQGDDILRLRGTGAIVARAGSGRDAVYARGPVQARISCGPGRDSADVDGNDTVARDCERVTRPRRSGATRAPAAAARARSATSARGAGSPTYADLVAATPGLRHWWRMSASEQTLGDGPTSGLVDRITRIAGTYFRPSDQGPTDDGDTAFQTDDYSGPLDPGVDDAVLHGEFTFEGWIRPDDDGVARGILDDLSGPAGAETGVALVREADGSLHATISAATDPRRVDLRTAPLDLAGRWHHVALTRTADRIALFVDGAVVGDGPAQTVTIAGSGSWSLATGGSAPVSGWLGGLDEIAIYDRALAGETIASHARAGEDGRPPVTTADPPLPGMVPAYGAVVTFTTAKGGSTFRCALDAAPLAPCKRRHALTKLGEGAHVLRVQATDRFGLVEATPAQMPFVVDSSLPFTLALVHLAADGDRRATVSLGSQKPGTFECAVAEAGPDSPADGTAALAAAQWSPCASGFTAPRGRLIGVRAVDASGNRDPAPAAIFVPPLGEGFAGPLFGLRTFAGARAEVAIVGPGFDGVPYECRIDGGPWAPCRATFRLPILHEGPHSLQARLRVPAARIDMTTAELRSDVGPSSDGTVMAGLQSPLLLERGQPLARRAPIVRLALNRAATLDVAIVRRGRTRIALRVPAKAGPNVVTLPTPALNRLATGRYELVVTARGTTGPAVTQRLAFALVRPLR